MPDDDYREDALAMLRVDFYNINVKTIREVFGECRCTLSTLPQCPDPEKHR